MAGFAHASDALRHRHPGERHQGRDQASALIAGTGGAPVNYMPNPLCEGAVVGTPGALPYYWVERALNGVTRQVVAFGTLADGTPYCDVRYFGTPTGTFALSTLDWMGDLLSVGGNVPITFSLYMAIVGGSTANITGFNLDIREETTNAAATPVITPTATLTRYSGTFSQTNGIMRASAGFWVNLPLVCRSMSRCASGRSNWK